MTKRFLTLTLFCCLSFTGLRAQSYYCMSYADYLENNWIELDTLFVKALSNGRKLWGANDYKLSTGNDSLDKVLKKDAFLVLHQDSLLMNCRYVHYQGADYDDKTFGNGYTRAYIFGRNQLCFVQPWADQKALFMGGQGLLGALAASSMALENTRCFLVKLYY